MNLCDSVLFLIILAIFPFTLYFLYLIYTKTLQIEKSRLILDFVIFSSFYLILKYNFNYVVSLILINVPFIIAYYGNRKLSVFILSILSIYYYHIYFDINYFFLIAEYLIYYGIYQLDKEKFFNIFIIIKFLILTIFLIKTNYIILLNVILFIIIKFLLYSFKKIEQVISLHKSLEQTNENNKMYESLFKITHEIKNPIAVIKGYLDMYDENNEKHKKYIPIIKSETNRVLVLLEDFLSINRIKINKDIIDISLLIEEVIISFEPLLKNRHIKVNFEQDEIYIEADYDRLKQVFINLIKNSIEAINNNGIIDIDIVPKNKYIYINVKDNGIGMKKEEIEKLNYPFYTTKQNGTGLGLYLSKEIIKKHDGTMSFESIDGMNIGIKLPYDARLN